MPLLWLPFLFLLYLATPSVPACSLTYRYTNWTPVLPHCHVAPLRPMILPTFRKRRSAGAPYCVHGCCVPGWADSKFTALPCVVRRARHTHVLMVTSSNPIDTNVPVDDSYRHLHINAEGAASHVAPMRFQQQKPHHDIMCGAHAAWFLMQHNADAHQLKFSAVRYTKAQGTGLGCKQFTMVDRIAFMDYNGTELWGWTPADHLPCLCVTNECWHFNGVFFVAELNAVLLTSHFLSGFLLVDVATQKIRWAVAEHWPARRADVQLKRCRDSPIMAPWCGPAHRGQHLGGSRFLLFINGCVKVGRAIDKHNQVLCRLMHCPKRWQQRSVAFVIEVDEPARCYRVLEEVPLPFQSLAGRARLTVEGHISGDTGTFDRKGQQVRSGQMGITSNYFHNGIPVHVAGDCGNTTVTIANPLYSWEAPQAIVRLHQPGAGLWLNRTVQLLPGSSPVPVPLPLPHPLPRGPTFLTLHVSIPALGLACEVELNVTHRSVSRRPPNTTNATR
eukprot:EG_transcript_9927